MSHNSNITRNIHRPSVYILCGRPSKAAQPTITLTFFFYFFELKIGSLVTRDLRNFHANFSFTLRFRFRVRIRMEKTVSGKTGSRRLHLFIMRRLVCLSVCQPPLAPSAWHGRGPRPRCLSPLCILYCFMAENSCHRAEQ